MKVRFTLLTEMLGTQPADEEVFQTYIASKAPETTGPEEVGVDADKIEEKGTTVFRRDPITKQLCVCDYHIKGCFKSRGDAIRARLDASGRSLSKEEKKALKGDWGSIRGKLDDDLHVFPRFITLGKTEPDGVLERPLRAQTMQGPRVSLARSEYVNGGLSFECDVQVRPGRISQDMVLAMLYEMRFVGIGQWRNAGYGRVDVEVDMGKGFKPLEEIMEAA